METEASACKWSISNLSSLVTHPAVASDAEFQLHLVQFIFINAFFVLRHTTSDIACVRERYVYSYMTSSPRCLPMFFVVSRWEFLW